MGGLIKAPPPSINDNLIRTVRKCQIQGPPWNSSHHHSTTVLRGFWRGAFNLALHHTERHQSLERICKFFFYHEMNDVHKKYAHTEYVHSQYAQEEILYIHTSYLTYGTRIYAYIFIKCKHYISFDPPCIGSHYTYPFLPSYNIYYLPFFT